MQTFKATWKKSIFKPDLQFIALIFEDNNGKVIKRVDITKALHPQIFLLEICSLDIALEDNVKEFNFVVWPYYKDWGVKENIFVSLTILPGYTSISVPSVYNKIPCNNVWYFGPKGTSGYALAVKNYIYDLVQRGIPVSWYPLEFDTSEPEIKTTLDIVTDFCKHRTLSSPPDLIILHSTPENWPGLIEAHKNNFAPNAKIIGQTVWETDKICDKWVPCLNAVDEVWVPCKWNKQVFQKCGVSVPIKIVPHIVEKAPLPEAENVELLGKYFYSTNKKRPNLDSYVFYNISQWTPRKGIEDLIHAYCGAFLSKDNVLLLLKVHGSSYTEAEISKIDEKIKNCLSFYSDPPDIFFIEENISQQQIAGIHKIGDCYISLCKAEGWGLGAFEATQYDKDVVMTGYGGQLDFLLNYPKSHLVKYKEIPCQGMDWIPWYDSSQKWAQPDIKDSIRIMKKCYEKYNR